MDLLSVSNESDLLEVVRKSLKQSAGPISATQLSKGLTGPFKTKSKTLGGILEAEVAAGRLHRFGTLKSPKYWDRGPEDVAMGKVLQRLQRGPSTGAAITTLLKGLAPDRQQQLLDGLVRAGRMFVVPAVGRSKAIKYAASPPSVRPYLVDLIKRLRAEASRLELVGIPMEKTLATACEMLRETDAVLGVPANSGLGDAARQLTPTIAGSSNAAATPEMQATRPCSDSETQTSDAICSLILRRMRELDPAVSQGAALPIPELRKSLDFHFAGKQAFDAAVLELVRQRRAFVHRHDLPECLDAEVRMQLVTDEAGNHFSGISLPIDHRD